MGEQWSGKGEKRKYVTSLKKRCFGVQKELPHSRSGALIEARVRSFSGPLCQKGRFLAAVVLKRLRAASGIFENQGAARSGGQKLAQPSPLLHSLRVEPAPQMEDSTTFTALTTI